MFNDDSQVDDLDTTSDEVIDDTDTVSDDETEDTTDYKAEAAKWKAIAERKKKKEEKGEETTTATQSSTAPTDAMLARLEARGVIDSDVQDYLINAAKREGRHPIELLNDPYFKDRVTAMSKEKEVKGATPSPSSRVPESKKDLSYWITQVEAGKPNSTDPAMRRQVREAIVKKS